MSKPTVPYGVILNCLSDGAFEIDNARQEQLGMDGLMAVLKQLAYPATPLNMHRLEEKLLKLSNHIRLPDDLTILEVGFNPTKS